MILLTNCVGFAYYNLMLYWYKAAEIKTASTNFT